MNQQTVASVNDATNAAPGSANGPSARNTANYTISDQFNWLKGSHSFQFGADYTRLDDWANNYNNVPSLAFGFSTNFDPADAIFTSTNFPGSTSGDRNNAKALYALLTGRVSSISAWRSFRTRSVMRSTIAWSAAAAGPWRRWIGLPKQT